MLFIFDWDGTLCDSLDKIVTCTKTAATNIGIDEPSAAAVKNIIGLSLIPAIQQVFPGISDPDLKRLLQEYARLFKENDTGTTKLYPGAQTTLENLRDRGHQIAIATGKSRQGLTRVLNELELHDWFHASRCADETASKPDPMMLREILVELRLSPDDAVMIGDTEYDMAMARHLDMRRIAVSYGAHTIDRLHPYDPVHCLDEIAALLDWRHEQND